MIYLKSNNFERRWQLSTLQAISSFSIFIPSLKSRQDDLECNNFDRRQQLTATSMHSLAFQCEIWLEDVDFQAFDTNVLFEATTTCFVKNI